MVLATFLEKIDLQLAIILDQGSDEELALASYIHGHIDVVNAQYNDSTTTLEHFLEQLEHSLIQAFEQGELDHSDQVTANSIWQKLETFSYLQRL